MSAPFSKNGPSVIDILEEIIKGTGKEKHTVLSQPIEQECIVSIKPKGNCQMDIQKFSEKENGLDAHRLDEDASRPMRIIQRLQSFCLFCAINPSNPRVHRTKRCRQMKNRCFRCYSQDHSTLKCSFEWREIVTIGPGQCNTCGIAHEGFWGRRCESGLDLGLEVALILWERCPWWLSSNFPSVVNVSTKQEYVVWLYECLDNGATRALVKVLNLWRDYMKSLTRRE